MGNNKLESTHSTIKNYTYTRRAMALSFGLDVDDKLGRRDFLELLQTAAKELEAEIAEAPSEE